jgi:ubiquinone biosynthesis protein UbiJ
MNLCDDGHREVCFEGRDCPVCEKVDEFKEQVTDLEKQVESLENRLEEAQS